MHLLPFSLDVPDVDTLASGQGHGEGRVVLCPVLALPRDDLASTQAPYTS